MKKIISIFSVLTFATCISNDPSLTNENIGEINKYLNFTNSILRYGYTNTDMFSYNIAELNMVINLPKNAYIAGRDNFFQGDMPIDPPAPFEKLHEEMYENDKYLVCWNGYFIIDVIRLKLNEDRPKDVLYNDIDKIEKLIIEKFDKTILYFEGIIESNGINFFVYNNADQEYFYCITANDYVIILDINIENRDYDWMIEEIIKSIFLLDIVREE
jgi:hypothetical protein